MARCRDPLEELSPWEDMSVMERRPFSTYWGWGAWGALHGARLAKGTPFGIRFAPYNQHLLVGEWASYFLLGVHLLASPLPTTPAAWVVGERGIMHRLGV